ncbi:uncharacterized protein LY89DRAFT_594722 [Mollisia scopiformis]|uniref:Core domain-containing protein n=1 Tax=Mollisia scopiformis TaxID=149040 RepID=A0A194WUX5_MOLSC|nr:uncharacterized protein LY89DRAFT_594722 [Mollisia scopiformis]KUJ11755.1 hypothetical protein LY89DRAFT_594722 [Mollisia scopiformis]
MAARCVARSCPRLSTSTSPSAAQAFMQLAPRRHLYNAPPVLDFLIPNVLLAALHHGWATKTVSKGRPPQNRAFTSSTRHQQTTAIFNPRKDDDGNDMNIEITPRAANRLKEIMNKDSNSNLALRITVESGGCHGFQYLMSLTTLPSPLQLSNSVEEEATLALNTSSSDPNAMPSGSPGPDTRSKHTKDEKDAKLGEDDIVFEADGAMVVMDQPSLELLKDSKVDFTMELIGSQFKIVDNPLATSSCGCGTSFDIKI